MVLSTGIYYVYAGDTVVELVGIEEQDTSFPQRSSFASIDDVVITAIGAKEMKVQFYCHLE
jgi:hypothetical protein